MCTDSKSTFQVISDFDRTISCHCSIKGDITPTSYQTLFMYKNSSFCTDKKYLDVQNKFTKIEFNPCLTREEKEKHMADWFSEAQKSIIDLKFSRSDIKKASKCSEFIFRDGFEYLFKNFISNKIPILVASAGIGDVVYYKIKNEIGCNPDIEIASNFLEFDQNDVASGFIPPMIHSYNKNLITTLKKHYFGKLKNRKNIIVFGDSIGDVDIIDSLPEDNTPLKIGFINFEPNIHLESYLTVFDIVLVDPSSVQPLYPIFNMLFNGND